MKRKSFLAKAFMMLIAVLFSLTGTRAETLTVYEDATEANGFVPVYGYYGDAYNKCEFVVPATELNAMEGGTISQMTFYLGSPATAAWTGTFQVFLKEVETTEISEFFGTEGATVVYEGTLDGTGETMSVEFTKDYVYGGGNLLVGVYQTAAGNYKSAAFIGAAVDNSSISGYNYSNIDAITPTQRNFIPKTTFTYTPGSGVVYAKPTDLVVSNLTAHEATISWTEPEGKVDGYAYQYKLAAEEWGTEESTTAEASVTLTELKAGKPYNFRVKAIYGEDASAYVYLNFTTDCEMVTLPFVEGWDDGIGCWTVVNQSIADNAPTISAISGNNVFNFSSYGSADVYDQYLISPEFDGSKVMDVEFYYTPSSPYGAESFEVGYSTTTNDIDAFTWGEPVIAEVVSWTLWEGTFPEGTKYVAIHYTSEYSYHLYVDDFWFTENNGLYRPTDLAASEVTGKSVLLSWTENGTATAWQICLNGDLDNLIAADSNPFTLTGLTPETDYVVYVRPVEGEEFGKWSEGLVFTTGALYTVPADLTAKALATTATVSWWCNPEATNIEVQYAERPALPYDNGTYASSIGGSSSAEWSWGVMYPGNVVTASSLTKVSIYETAYNTGDITINVYQGGDDAPGTLLYTETVTTEAAGAFHEVTLAEAVTITPGENLWITLTETGTFVMADCVDPYRERNNQWVWDGEAWGNIGDLSSNFTNCGWMIRADVGTTEPTWITAGSNENPCILEGLTPETRYLVRVKAIYVEEGESDWATTSFTTMNINPIPWDVVVTPDCTTATIEWAGISDSYEVKYRIPTIPGEASFFDDFENGLGDWTIYTDGEAPKADGWYTVDPSNGLSFNAYSGTACASSWSWTAQVAYLADNWLVTPKVTFEKVLKFWVRTNAGYPDNYEVLLSTTGNAEADFTVTLQAMAEAPAVSEWTEVVIDLSDYAGQEGYIAIHHQDNDKNYLLIDDFGIYAEDTPAGEWVTVPTTETSVELTGLEEATEYEYTIIGIKDDVANEGTALATFTTLTSNPVPFNIAADLAADGATLTWEGEGESYVVRYRKTAAADAVFEEDFDGGDQIPEGWTTYTEGEGPGFAVEEFNGSAAAVAYSYDNDSYTAYAADNWLITPSVTLVDLLKFTVKGDPSYPDSYEVLFSTTGNAIADFTTTLQDWTNEQGDIAIDLSAYAGQTGYVAIHHQSTDMFALAIDDFGIYEVTEAEWTELAVTDATATISGLDTNQAYEYQIQSVKGESKSEWSDLDDFALITLDGNGNNSSLIKQFDGKFAHVTLANRTLYQDNTWNTIYLPFDLTPEELAASPLSGADVRTFKDFTIDGESVTLNFTPEGEKNSIDAGNPYIVKWASGSGIVNPEFANVNIDATEAYIGGPNSDETAAIYFEGLYDAYQFEAENTSILFIGADNKLNYPLAGATIGATRGYFYLLGISAGEESGVKFFTNLDDEDPTGIADLNETKADGNWYDLSGRKLAGKPGMKGIYVNGGRKVTVK